MSAQPLHRLKNLEVGAGALHPRGRDHDAQRRAPLAKNTQDVLEGRARGRGDQPDDGGEHGEFAFALGIEEPLPFETLAQLVEGQLQRALAAGLQLADDQLEVAPRFVHPDLSERDDLDPVFQVEGDARGIPPKQRAAELPVLVPQCEIDVARRRTPEIADLAGDPARRNRVRHRRAHSRQHLAHPHDAGRACGGCRLDH